jgi:hypothetical protein
LGRLCSSCPSVDTLGASAAVVSRETIALRSIWRWEPTRGRTPGHAMGDRGKRTWTKGLRGG